MIPSLRGRVAAAIVLALVACSDREPGVPEEVAADRATVSTSRRPSLVLVSIDTLRSDRLSVYGHESLSTPAFERLARDGVLFERAYTVAPLTLPAHASILTGLEPPEHGVRDNLGYRLTRIPTVADRLADAGYATGAAVSSYVLRGETGIGAGFAVWDDDIETAPETTLGELERRGAATLDRALAWLRATDEPFFLFLHLFEPHTPYDPPPPFAGRHPPYEGEVAEADRILGRLLDELERAGLYDEAAILVLSDHGEGLGDHGEEEHGILLFRETLQVPLLVKLPGGRTAGTRVAEPVQVTDVAPTLLELAGVAEPNLPGRSLLSVLDGESHGERTLYAETWHPRLRYGWSELLSAIRGPLHLIQGPSPELYDLERDPGEERDVLAEHGRDYRELREFLRSRHAPPEEPFEEGTETREALASLGYLGGGAAGTASPLPNPRDRVHQVEELQEALRAIRRGEDARAVAMLRPAVEANPQWIDAWQFLALALDHLGRRQEAFDAYRRAFDLSGGSPLLAKPLAKLALELGRPDDALAFLRLAAEHEPDEPALLYHQARILLLTGRSRGALEPASRAVRVAPDDADAHYFLGATYIGLGRLEEAETHLRRALELRPGHAAARNDLAMLLQSQGQGEETGRPGSGS